MAKNMARIENGVVMNIEWCADSESESAVLKDAGDYLLEIGDTYSEGHFYRDGVLLMTPLEEMQKQLNDLDAAYAEGVNSV